VTLRQPQGGSAPADEPKRSAAEFRLIGCGWRRLVDLNAEGGLARDPAHGTSAITRLAPPNCALRAAQGATSPTAPVRRRFKQTYEALCAMIGASVFGLV
jgi:hypothetical protein